MKLLTFGGVSVEGATFRREKPLLLLAYLCLEGPQPRRRLASLFWPDAANPMNSLAQNLIRLRPLTGAVLEHGSRVEALLPSDTQAFRDHCRAARPADALTLYTGAFLEGLTLDLNPDLEEWLLDTRETLAREARAAHLNLAGHHHARAEHTLAHAHAERAYHTPGAPPCDPADLHQLWQILGPTDHPLTLTLRRDASDLGLTLPAPALPTTPLIGRAAELAALSALPPGQIAWISGPPGIGKTTLLSALAGHGWRVLPARSGLPLATLEPLSPHPPGSAADALNLLRDTRLKLALDDWEDMDDTTRATLTLAARQHPGATIAITARQPPALPTHHHIPLHSLTEHDLHAHPGAHAATGGHPTLLASYLNGTPPDRTLDAHLTLLGPDHRRLFLALAAQDTPNLAATRAALNLSAATVAATLDTLTREGLTTPGGSIRASTPARQLLDAHPLDTTLIHLHLARHHPHDTAWPHWLSARDLWELADTPKCAAAAHWHADQEMKRGYPAKAARTLEVAPQTDEVKLLRGWALIRGGCYLKALSLVKDNDTSVSQAWTDLRIASLFYNGSYEECEFLVRKSLSEVSGSSSGYVRYFTGALSFRRGDYEKAYGEFLISRMIFISVGDEYSAKLPQVMAFTSISLSIRRLHESLAEVMDNVKDNFYEYAVLLSNIAHIKSSDTRNINTSRDEISSILDTYLLSARLFEKCENKAMCAATYNSIGVEYHNEGKFAEAAKYYNLALKLSESSGDKRVYAIVVANLSELESSSFDFKASKEFMISFGFRELAFTVEQNKL
ncbi:hypothetical protein [Deinococcus sp. ME38]|uniref:hypothetical protein n=1 Tax=Deinococcus sp. ME38 TaxID=3400344 RepID=UPI003B5B43E7